MGSCVSVHDAALLHKRRFRWGSSWSPPVTDILLFIRGYVEAGRGLPLLCMAQSLFQVIYLSLHGLTVVLSLGYATAYLGMALAHLGIIHTPILIPFIAPILLKVKKITLPLRPYGFCLLGVCLTWVFLVWSWPYHVYPSHSLTHEFFPTDGANCRDKVWSPSPNVWNPGPKSPIQWIL